MKKIITSILFYLSFVQLANAQSFVHFPDSATWNIRYHYGQPPYYYINYRLAGDTVIGPFTYKKLMNDTVLTAVIREDTVQNKVFAKVFYTSFYQPVDCDLDPTNCICVESLLFDYNLSPGDTFVGIFNSIGYTTCYYKVVCEDSVFLGNTWRKRIGMHPELSMNPLPPPCDFGIGELMIEGIGTVSGLLESIGLGINGERSELLCFGTESQAIYPITSPTGCLPLGIDQRTVDNVVYVYPNPAEGIINLRLSFNEEIIQVEIIGPYGRVIRRIEQKNLNLINVSDLSSGIYFLKITTDKMKNIFKKIIIQN